MTTEVGNQQSFPDPPSSVVAWIMPAIAVILLCGVLFGIRTSHSWPLVHDVPLIHYIVLLMDNGRAPYRDIADFNMPFTYLVEWAVVHGFGPGPAGVWRADTLTGLVAIASAAWITGPGHRWAGIAGGALAYLSHLGEGPAALGQRDWFLSVICLLGAGCLATFLRERRRSPRRFAVNPLVWLAGFMALLGAATLIKPPVVIVPAAVLLALTVQARRRGHQVASLLIAALAAVCVPLVTATVFLLRWSALPAFLTELHTLLPWYAAQHQLPIHPLLLSLVPHGFGIVTVLVLAVFFVGGLWQDKGDLFLLSGTLAGAFLFLAQRKGWTYQLNLETVFLSLFCLLTLDVGLRRAGSTRWLTLAAVAALFVTLVPFELRAVRHASYPLTTIDQLQADLTNLGGSQLSGNVQCLDMTMGGCINILYRLRLLEPTGLIYDAYLFPDHPTPVTLALQDRFLREIESHPPRIFVLSSHIWPSDRNGYEELANFPAFRTWLSQNYGLLKEQPIPTHSNAAGYRIYQHL